METTIYNRNGDPVAYMVDDSEHSIYLWNGKPVAYLDNNKVYGYNGTHLGWYEIGIMRDSHGHKIGFTSEKSPSVTKVQPVKSVKLVKHVKAVKNVATVKPVFSILNSNESLEDFLSSGF